MNNKKQIEKFYAFVTWRDDQRLQTRTKQGVGQLFVSIAVFCLIMLFNDYLLVVFCISAPCYLHHPLILLKLAEMALRRFNAGGF